MTDFITKAKILIELLSDLNMTLAVAESCTGGLLSKIITDVPGVSSVYKGGICVYCNEVKNKLLGVSADTLEKFGAVSEQTASQMSRGVCRLFESDIGVAITGIAGPASDNTEKPVGLIYVSVTAGNDTKVLELKNNFSNDVRNSNRYEAAHKAADLLEETLRLMKGKRNGQRDN